MMIVGMEIIVMNGTKIKVENGTMITMVGYQKEVTMTGTLLRQQEWVHLVIEIHLIVRTKVMVMVMECKMGTIDTREMEPIWCMEDLILMQDKTWITITGTILKIMETISSVHITE